LLTAIHVAEAVCEPVAHRQLVLTIPKRLRLHARFDRKLLGKLCSCAWTCIQAEVQRLLGREDVLPGMIAAIQTHGELLHWHPHFHMLLACGAFTPEGEFLELPELDLERLQAAWQEAVFRLYLAEDKIEPEVVENMRTWPGHRRAAMVGGFSVDQSVYLPAGDRAGIERLVQYMTRSPFSLSRLVKVTESGQVIYKAEKYACQALERAAGRRPGDGAQAELPDPRSAGFPGGVHPTYSAPGRAPDPLLRLVLEQGPWHAPQGGRGRRGGGTARRVIERRGRVSSGPPPRAPERSDGRPDLGHAHQAGVRDRPVGLS
jgi:hypothetical protein